jgi:hypothetical protein
MRPRDTSPEAWNLLMDLLRKIPQEEKLRRALDLTAAARKLSEAGLRQAFPDAGEREIFLRLAQRQLGEELFQKVFGDEWRQYGSTERRT